MKTSLAALVSLLFAAACSSAIDTGTTTTAGAGTTTGAATTTTTAGAGTTTGAATTTTTAGTGTTAGSGTTTGGTGDACATYPGDKGHWGQGKGQIFADFPLAGGAAGFPLATTPTVDSTSNFIPSFSFEMLHEASCNGFRYVFLDISSVWCIHCQEEAQTLPSQNVPGWLAKGGLVLSVLVQNGNASGPATPQDLATWIQTYHVNYPMALDNGQILTSGLPVLGWPTNMIIDLRTMKVIDSVYGNDPKVLNEYGGTLDSCTKDADCYAAAPHCDTAASYTCKQ